MRIANKKKTITKRANSQQQRFNNRLLFKSWTSLTGINSSNPLYLVSWIRCMFRIQWYFEALEQINHVHSSNNCRLLYFSPLSGQCEIFHQSMTITSFSAQYRGTGTISRKFTLLPSSTSCSKKFFRCGNGNGNWRSEALKTKNWEIFNQWLKNNEFTLQNRYFFQSDRFYFHLNHTPSFHFNMFEIPMKAKHRIFS